MDPTLTFGWRPWVTLIVFAFSLLFVVRPVSIPLRFLQQEFRWCRNRSSPLLFPLDFSTAPLIAVIILSIIGSLSVNVLSVGIVGDGVTLIPYAICLLFFSLSYICLSLDLTGCFAYLATKAASLGGTSKPRTLLIFFGLASLVTLLTSNDIVILTLTPIILRHSEMTKTNPLPFLFAEFFAANIWSSALYIGNPTNIIIASARSINFLQFSYWLALPTLGAGLTALLLLFLTFRSQLREPLSSFPPVDVSSLIPSVSHVVVSLFILVSSLITIAAVSFTRIPIWYATVPFAILSIVVDGVYDWRGGANQARWKKVVASPISNGEEANVESQTSENNGTSLLEEDKDEDDENSKQKKTTAQTVEIDVSVRLEDSPANGETSSSAPPSSEVSSSHSNSSSSTNLSSSSGSCFDCSCLTLKFPTVFEALRRMPWKIVPFILPMFILVELLRVQGWVDTWAEAISQMTINPTATVYLMMTLSALMCNVVNNQPMTILFAKILDSPSFSSSPIIVQSAAFATIAGSNFGANLTLIGALAGIMWSKLLKTNTIDISYFTFCKYGFIIMPWVILVASSILALEYYAIVTGGTA